MRDLCRLSRAIFFSCLLALISNATAVAQVRTDPHASVSADFVPADDKASQPARVVVTFRIKEGFHAQSHTPTDKSAIKFEVKLDPVPGFTFAEPVYPAGKDETYEALGTLNVYTGTVVVPIPVTADTSVASADVRFTGSVRYQICDDRVCYMPQNGKFSATGLVQVRAMSEPPTTAPATRAAIVDAGTTRLPTAIQSSNDRTVLSALGLAFVVGLIFNVMPCVLPVLPLKIMGFYEVSQHNRARCMALGAVFSLGVISLFAVLGVMVLALKVISWGELFSKAWFVWTVVVILVGLAVGSFGAFTFQLPTVVYQFTPSHDTYVGNFLLGAFTAILATPCTAYLLPPLMGWAINQPGWLSTLTMVVVGVGMASPYFVLSAFPQVARRFPRTGPWPELFKQMMGFMLLVAASYFAGGRLIHGGQFWWIVVAMTTVSGIFLVARIVQLSKSALAVAIGAFICVGMVGSVTWWTLSVTGALQPRTGGTSTANTWQPFTRQTFDASIASGKIVLVKFTANWCGTCQYIEGTTYSDPNVWKGLTDAGVITLKADLTDENPEAQALLLTLNPAGGIPLTAIYSPRLASPIVLTSLYDATTLLDAVSRAR